MIRQSTATALSSEQLSSVPCTAAALGLQQSVSLLLHGGTPLLRSFWQVRLPPLSTEEVQPNARSHHSITPKAFSILTMKAKPYSWRNSCRQFSQQRHYSVGLRDPALHHPPRCIPSLQG